METLATVAFFAALWWLVKGAPGAPGSALAEGVRQVSTLLQGVEASLTLTEIEPGKYLEPESATAFMSMRSAAAEDGVTFVVNSAWRSNDEQAALYAAFQAGTGNKAAPVSWSNHEAGRAVDIESDSGRNAAHSWLQSNAGTYGFQATVSGEPWHWEYTA